ncbi:MAG: hypothetical protein ACKOXP_00565 [Flavobacteriales bacterium]
MKTFFFPFIKKHGDKLTLLFLSALFILWFFPEFIFHPNHYLLTNSGDGLKSYYCFFYHTHFDDSLIQFKGMNYPHGEHYLFTDGFPLLAWTIQCLPFLKPFGIVLIHWSLMLSLWLTPFFLYLILKRLKTETWIALLGSLSLFMLQPQFPRLFSHLSLSYSVFFPLSWYLLLRFKSSEKKVAWTFILMFNQLVWYFTHPYLGFMISVFYGLDWIVQQFGKRTLRTRISTFIPVITPMLMVQIFLKLTDQITDRPENPFGFFEYQAHWKSIFLPSSGVIHDWIGEIISFDEFRWEGQAYVGFLTMSICLLGVFWTLFQLVKNRKITSPLSMELLMAFFASGLLLILSFGFPFNGNPSWLKIVPFLKQFRALGRFSWPFYFVAGVVSVHLLSQFYQFIRRWKNSQSIHFVSVFIISLLFILQMKEGLRLANFPKTFSNNIFEKEHLAKDERALIAACQAVKASYQAILPLPWFHIGSEIFGKEAPNEAIRLAFLLSAHTGKPLYAVMLGRTSISQTIDYFHSFDVSEKINQPIHLLLIRNQANTLYEEDENSLFDHARKYVDNELYQVSILTPEKQTLRKHKKRIILRDYFGEFGTTGGQLHHNNYCGQLENYNTILSLDSTRMKRNQWYEINFDYYPDWTHPLDNVCYLEYIHPKTQAVNWIYSRNIGSFPGISSQKIHVRFRFKSTEFPCEYHCFLKGSSKNVSFELNHLTVEEILPKK